MGAGWARERHGRLERNRVAGAHVIQKGLFTSRSGGLVDMPLHEHTMIQCILFLRFRRHQQNDICWNN